MATFFPPYANNRTGFLRNESSQDEQGAGDQFLKELGLSQSQVAALLGVTPQVVSKGVKEEGVDFFAKRAQKLYAALLFVGGDNFSLAAVRLSEAARQNSWGVLEAEAKKSITPSDLYRDADELWVISDSPGKVLEWSELSGFLFSTPNQEQRVMHGAHHKVMVFFFSTIEGAEAWAEVFEREMLKPAIHDYKISQLDALQINAYVFFVVTNLTTYTQDFLIVDPGSQCMDVFTSRKSPKIAYWNAGSYVYAENNSSEFIKTVRHLELGTSAIKANFFPTGMKLQKEHLDLGKHGFMDGLIALRGKTLDEDMSENGDGMAGGIFRSVVGRPLGTGFFNKKAKFCPLLLLAYKRKPGDSVHRSERTVGIIQSELDRAREAAEMERPRDKGAMLKNDTSKAPASFW